MVNNRAFGIEIEFIGSRRLVAQCIRELGVPCEVEHYNHNTRTHWKIVTDASLGYNNAGEVVSPILTGEQGLRELELVCQALDQAGATVNRQCGLHIHLDSRDMAPAEIQTVFKRYADYESQIDRLMPRSRRGNPRWCGTLNSNQTETVKQRDFNTKDTLASAMGRYHKVNLTNIASRGSIEFRQHSGTTEYIKILNWLTFLQQFVERSIALTGITRTVRRIRTKQRWYNQLRTAYEEVGGSVTWSRRYMAWAFEQNGNSFMLNNYQIERLYQQGSSMKNVGLREDWIPQVQDFGGFAPMNNVRQLHEEDSLEAGLEPETVDWLQRRAAELN